MGFPLMFSFHAHARSSFYIFATVFDLNSKDHLKSCQLTWNLQDAQWFFIIKPKSFALAVHIIRYMDRTVGI